MASSESTTRTPRSRQPRNRGLRIPPGLGYDRRADLVNDAPDLSGTIKQVAKAGDDVVIMPRVTIQDRRGVGDDVVKRQSHLAADRLHRGARGALLLGLEQLQRVQRRGDVAGVDLQKLAVAIVEVVRMGTLDIERADDRAVIDQWHGQGAARVLGALDVERVLGRVGAEVALTGRGDKPRHAVPLLARHQLASGGQGRHALAEQGDQLVGGLLQEPDLDVVKAHQVLHVTGDVVLEQIGALLDPKLRELLRGEVGQLVAGLGNRVDLELLLGLVGDLARQGDQVGQRVRGIEHWRHGHSQVPVSPDLHHRAGRPPRSHRTGERTRVGSQNFRLGEDMVKLAAGHLRLRIGERQELGVRPDDPQVRIDHGHAVGDRVEDLLGLDDHAHPAHGRELRCVDIDPAELRVPQERQRLGDRVHRHHVERFAKLFERGFPLRHFAIDDQQSRVVGHVGYPSPDEARPGLLVEPTGRRVERKFM